MESRLRTALSTVPGASRYLVGVSGGRDSVFLLHQLHALGFRRLIVCHLDHGLRGRASAADYRFVERLAEKLCFDFEGRRCDVAKLAEQQKLSIEAAARKARYDFFADVARRRRCRTLLVAHHADDQAETFLFNLLRGTGASGLGGMRSESERDGLKIVRPLLGIWRTEIEQFVRKHRIRFREDASNADLVHARNRMRQRIIPFLEKEFGREVTGALLRASQILGAENQWLEELLPEPGAELSVKELRASSVGFQRRLIQKWLRNRKVPNIGYKEVEAVRALLEPEAKPKINLPGGFFGRRRAGKLFIQ